MSADSESTFESLIDAFAKSDASKTAASLAQEARAIVEFVNGRSRTPDALPPIAAIENAELKWWMLWLTWGESETRASELLGALSGPAEPVDDVALMRAILALLQDELVVLPEALGRAPAGLLLAEAAAVRAHSIEDQKHTLAARIESAKDPAFRTLLRIDLAVLCHADADASQACACLIAALGERSPETWLALVVLEHVLKKGRLVETLPLEGTAARVRAEVLSEAAASDITRRALGVRRWQIEPARIADAWMWAARAAVVDDPAAASRAFECAERCLRGANDPVSAGAILWGARAAFEVAGDLERTAQWGNKSELRAPLREAVVSRDVLLAHIHRPDSHPSLDEALSDPDAQAIARAVHFVRTTREKTLHAWGLAWRGQSEFAPKDSVRQATALASAWFFAVAKESSEAQASLSRALTSGVAPPRLARLAPVLARLADDDVWLDTALAKQLELDPGVDAAAFALLRYVRSTSANERARTLDDLGSGDGAVLARVLGNLSESDNAQEWLQTLQAAERVHAGSSDARLGIELLAALAALRVEQDTGPVGRLALNHPVASWLHWTAIAAVRHDAKKAGERARFASENCETEQTEFALVAAMFHLREGISEQSLIDLRHGGAHPIASLAAELAATWLGQSSREKLATKLYPAVGALERFASQLVKRQRHTPLLLEDAYGGDRDLIVAAALGEALFAPDVDRAAHVLIGEGGPAEDIGLWLRTQTPSAALHLESGRPHAAWFHHAPSLQTARSWLRHALTANAANEDVADPWNAIVECSPAARQPALRAWTPTAAPGAVRPPSRPIDPSLDDLIRETGKLPVSAAAKQLAILGWSLLAEGRVEQAVVAFERATTTMPRETSAWIGLRCASKLSCDTTLVARSCARLGQLTGDAEVASNYFEEAGIAFESLGETRLAEACYASAFDKSPWRGVAFEKLFRAARDQKDAGELLALTSRRLAVADDPREMLKIYWERARSFRQTGDLFAASEALTNVNMLDEHHLGALALSSEIAIKEDRHDDAALALERLATLEAAPLGSRLTAAIAAIDVLENKLSQPARALALLDRVATTVAFPLALTERQVRLAILSGNHEAAARGLETLMRNRPIVDARVEAARLALAIYRDKLSDDHGVLRALRQLLSDAPVDGEAIDQLLARDDLRVDEWRDLLVKSLDGIRASLRASGPDYVCALRLARVAHILGARTIEALAWSLALATSSARAHTAVEHWKASAPVPEALTEAELTSEEMDLLRLDVIASPLGGAYDGVVAFLAGRDRHIDSSEAPEAMPEAIPEWASCIASAFGATAGVVTLYNRVPPTASAVARLAAASAWGLLPLALADDDRLVLAVVGLCRALKLKVAFTDHPGVTEAQRYFEGRFSRKERKELAKQLEDFPPVPEVVRVWAQRGREALRRAALLFSLDYQQVANGPFDETSDDDQVRTLVSETLSREFVTIAARIWGHDD